MRVRKVSTRVEYRDLSDKVTFERSESSSCWLKGGGGRTFQRERTASAKALRWL